MHGQQNVKKHKICQKDIRCVINLVSDAMSASAAANRVFMFVGVEASDMNGCRHIYNHLYE